MDIHSQRYELSYQNLEAARKRASEREKYAVDSARKELTEWVEQKFKKTPHPWQLDVGESIMLGLDSVVIAPTGAGKTLPFVIPLARNPDKKIIIISPLIALQHDMVKRFKKMGLAAVAVNNETKSNKLLREIKEHKYRVILTSPEMCLLDTSFRPILTSEGFAPTILAYVIDEAHCISQWSGDFRPTYGQLDQLRAFVPLGVPILATSATLNPKALADVVLSLKINLSKAFFLNLGNDRPNIALSTQSINSSTDISSLDNYFDDVTDSVNTLQKTIIFTNNRQITQEICRHIRTKLPGKFDQSVTYFHALRSKRAKRRVLRKFRKGEIKVLVATEAAGMGADLRDVKRVIQFGLPPSLTVLVQRVGRAGRDPSMNAEAVMLFEKSALLQRQKKKSSNKDSTETTTTKPINANDRGKRAGQPKSVDDASSSAQQNASTSSTIEVLNEAGTGNGDEDGGAEESATGAMEGSPVESQKELTYAKKCEEALRTYIECEECLREVLDAHYDNPPGRRKPPTGKCCDRHKQTNLTVAPTPDTSPPAVQSEQNVSVDLPTSPLLEPNVTNTNRPSTPLNESAESSPANSPEKNKNANGKRPMGPAPLKIPVQRRGPRREKAIRTLTAWRENTYRALYTDTNWTPDVILPEFILGRIATNATLRTLEDFQNHLDPPWIFAEEHCEEIATLLHAADVEFTLSQHNTAAQKRTLKKAATEARKLQEKAAEDAARQRQRLPPPSTPMTPAAYMVPYFVPPGCTPPNFPSQHPHVPFFAPVPASPATPRPGILTSSRIHNTYTTTSNFSPFFTPYPMQAPPPVSFEIPATPMNFQSDSTGESSSITPTDVIDNSSAPITGNAGQRKSRAVKQYNPTTRKFTKQAISPAKKKNTGARKKSTVS